MRIKDFMAYVHENFNVSVEASRLIENALKYEVIEAPEKRHDILCFSYANLQLCVNCTLPKWK